MPTPTAGASGMAGCGCRCSRPAPPISQGTAWFPDFFLAHRTKYQSLLNKDIHTFNTGSQLRLMRWGHNWSDQSGLLIPVVMPLSTPPASSCEKTADLARPGTPRLSIPHRKTRNGKNSD
ncbi:hypothetical protein FHT44_003259 [Mycolicibacterium sp. BK634]|nr:hypothetical protein [Mycolicibacterium sp. BK634]